LKNNITKAITWSIFESFGLIVTQIFFNVAFTRLVPPSQFGLYALTSSILIIFKAIVDSGTYQSIIQTNEIDNRYIWTSLWANLFFGLLLFALLNLNSRIIAGYYNQPDLKIIINALSWTILFECSTVTARALLIRSLYFKAYAKISIISRIFSGLVGVILVSFNAGYWGLIIKDLLLSIALTLGVLYYSYKLFGPCSLPSLSKLKKILNFGTPIFLADQVTIFIDNFLELFIGKKIGLYNFSQFERSNSFATYAYQSPVVAINKVIFPALSRVESGKFESSYYIVLSFIYLLVLPIIVLGLTIGENILLLILGSDWAIAAKLFPYFCVLGIFYPLLVINLNALKVLGFSGKYFKWSLLGKVFSITMFLFVDFSLFEFIVKAIILSKIIYMIIVSYTAGKSINLNILKQLYQLRILFASALFLCVINVCLKFIFPDTLLGLILIILINGIFWTYFFIKSKAKLHIEHL
jgi:O-antigen/teichoic acid export membrane protein